MKIKALILSNNRSDLLSHSLHSLSKILHDRDYELVIVNHSGNINEGRAKLLAHINENDQYILSTEDDFLFNCTDGHFIDIAIKELERNPDVGKIRLRRSGDGQRKEKLIEQRDNLNIVECWRSGFSHNPHICHADLYRKLLPVPERGHLESEFGKRYNRLNLKTAKLNCYRHEGVATHIGNGRGVNF